MLTGINQMNVEEHGAYISRTWTSGSACGRREWGRGRSWRQSGKGGTHGRDGTSCGGWGQRVLVPPAKWMNWGFDESALRDMRKERIRDQVLIWALISCLYLAAFQRRSGRDDITISRRRVRDMKWACFCRILSDVEAQVSGPNRIPCKATF
ncbi:hypothetical protein TorRG33x02_170210 [Trema orientale]|uniref:Uncharacterized protein n=1 Tax=Trema orientale TaxID=63057 RepID=A0A2P5ENX6_TREOI|nr:hypothetical protein TorRG33x02_170210 [Trema orientale]